MFLSIAWSILFPQSNTDSEKRAIITKQISENKIEIDGLLNEPEWKMVLPAKDFIQLDPIQGSPATEKTEVYVIHDKENLYIGAILFDSNPDGILA